MRTPQDQDKFMLRLPDGMREQVKARAVKNLRSMNSEIVLMISHALSSEGSTAAGNALVGHPAAVSETAAVESGASTTHG